MKSQRSEYQHPTGYHRPEVVSDETRPTRIAREILLVDDEPQILSTLSSSLADSNYRVTTALGGQKALDLLLQKTFDLVITDLNMPEVDGIAVLRTAKERGADTKVIIMTGSMISDSRRRLLFRDANGFLSKPFGLTELYATVASCLGSKAKGSGLRSDISYGFPVEAFAP